MAKVLYTAEAHVSGAREGHGRTSDGALEVDLATPSELGGEGGVGTNPEQLFAIGYAACFESALGVVAGREKVDTGDTEIDSSVMLMPTDDGGFELAVALDVKLPGIDDSDRAVELVKNAHQVCPYSNATRGNIGVTLTAKGQSVD